MPPRKSRKRKLRRPTHLFLDYDGTLTLQDTMALLGHMPHTIGRPSLPFKPHPKAWQDIVDAYMKDYQVYKEQPYSWETYDRHEYSGWLEARRWVEENSAQRAQDAAFFKGVEANNVYATIDTALHHKNLTLRPGWAELFEFFLSASDEEERTDSTVEILSVNWSELAIRWALLTSAAHLNHPQQARLHSYIARMTITANELHGLKDPGGCSGRLIRLPPARNIRTARDKWESFTSSCSQFKASSSSSSSSSSTNNNNNAIFTVYIGDSATDFDCLVAADLGIWICDVEREEYANVCRETFKPLDFVPPALADRRQNVARIRGRGGRDGEDLFYWAPDFKTVIDALTVVA